MNNNKEEKLRILILNLRMKSKRKINRIRNLLYEEKADIAIFTEASIYTDEIETIRKQLRNYTVFCTNMIRKQGARRKGVMVILKQDLGRLVIDVEEAPDSDDQSGRLMMVSLILSSGRQLNIAGVYMPVKQAGLSNYENRYRYINVLNTLTRWKRKTYTEGCWEIIGGDFNGTLEDEDRASRNRGYADDSLRDFVRHNDLRDTLRISHKTGYYPTWYMDGNPNINARIDHLLISSNMEPLLKKNKIKRYDTVKDRSHSNL